MTTWFRLSGSKFNHLLISQEVDLDRFPLGKAACSPMGRENTDTLHSTNEIHSENFCRFCLEVVKKRF